MSPRARKFTNTQILAALTRAHGNASAAASQLAVSPTTVSRYIPPVSLPACPEVVLWHRLRTRPSRTDIRDQLVERYLPLVTHIAMKIKAKLPPHIDLDTIVSAGRVGLLGAIARYDHTRSVKFSSYATSCIRGAILDELRATDPESRLTRSRETRRNQEAALIGFTLGRTPTDAEVRDALGWTPHQYRASFAKQVETLESSRDHDNASGLGNPLAHTNEPTVPADNPFTETTRATALARATRGLPFEYRIVIHLYYAKGCTLRQIGEAMDLCESRTSQMRYEAVVWLRENKTRDELLDVLM